MYAFINAFNNTKPALKFQKYLVDTAKLISSQRPVLIRALQLFDAEDFGQFCKQARQTTHLQQAQQKAQAFPGDHLESEQRMRSTHAAHGTKLSAAPFAPLMLQRYIW